MTVDRKQPPQFLVTGSTGFIGRRVVRQLVADFGAQAVVCLVKAPVTPLEAEALEFFRASGLRLIQGDLVDAAVADSPPPKVDVVFHLAANIDTNATEDALRVNHIGTEHLLDWVKPVISGARIVYASSVAVHDRDRQPAGPIHEDSPLVARTAYGRTKRLSEEIMRGRASGDGYSWTILRLPTVYGPGQKPGGLFERLIHLASTGALLGRVEWPGRTSIIHVDDVAAVMIELSQRHDAAGETYCIASESPTVGELAQRIAQIIHRPRVPLAIPRPVLKLLRWIVWSRTAWRFVPRSARLPFWRLSLIVSDGFWFDTTKFRRAYEKPLRRLEQGGLSDPARDP